MVDRRHIENWRSVLIVRIVPLECNGLRAARKRPRLGNILLAGIRIEIVESARVQTYRHAGEVDVRANKRGIAGRSRQSGAVRNHIESGSIAICADIVRGRREVRDARGSNIVNTIRDDSVLKDWLVVVANVVTNRVSFEGLVGISEAGQTSERTNVIGKTELARISSRKSELRSRRHLIDDLTHAAAFIRAARFILKINDGGCVVRTGRAWQISGSLVCGSTCPRTTGTETIGQTSNLESVAVVIERRSRVINLVNLIDPVLSYTLVEGCAQ